MAGEIRRRIEAANEEAAARIIAGEPVLMDIAPAGEVIPGLTDRMILHAGPPLEWGRTCGAPRGGAASSLFANTMAGPMIAAGVAKDALLATLGLLTNNEFFFLGLSMASAKASADAARGRAHGTAG